jgi:hypothetical protein
MGAPLDAVHVQVLPQAAAMAACLDIGNVPVQGLIVLIAHPSRKRECTHAFVSVARH